MRSKNLAKYLDAICETPEFRGLFKRANRDFLLWGELTAETKAERERLLKAFSEYNE